MEKRSEKRPYVRPVSTCTTVRLESPVCSGSSLQVQSPDRADDNGITAQRMNQDFSSLNDFSSGDWTSGSK